MFQTSSAVALPKIKSNILNGSEIYCHCILLYIVIVFLIKPNNLELILRHPASPLNNTVPRKSRIALLSSICNKITTHFSCSCRNEGQRLDAFQIYYLGDALNCNKAISENTTFLYIYLNYYSFKIFPRF